MNTVTVDHENCAIARDELLAISALVKGKSEAWIHSTSPTDSLSFRADTKQFLENDLCSIAANGDCTAEIRDLLKRCSNILRSLNVYEGTASNEQSHVDGTFDGGDNSSYLDMSVRKPDVAVEVTEDSGVSESGRNEYVDVSDKNEQFTDVKRRADGEAADEDVVDDNIYDNYIVEHKSNGSSDVCEKKVKPTPETSDNHTLSLMANEKRDCPFSGLPAAHLTIQKARKIGHLNLNYRRRPFLHILNSYRSKKFYVGLVCDTMESDVPDWWMLMYNGSNQMKPSICIDLRRFELVRVVAKKHKRERDAGNADIKFELHEKLAKNASKKIAPIIYQFSTSTTDECDQWYSTLLLLNSESSHSISSGTNRKLPMLPPYECDDGVNSSPEPYRHSSGLLYTNQDLHNYSEGVYEEPEEFYRHIDKPTATSSPISLKSDSVHPANVSDALFTYDVPKSPARPIQTAETSSIAVEVVKRQPDTREVVNLRAVDNADDYDKVIVDSTSSTGRTKINELRIKLTSHFKEQSQKYMLDSSTSPVASISLRKKSVSADPDHATDSNKVQQISSVRKFVTHLARMKRSSALNQTKSPKLLRSPKPIKREKKSSVPKTLIHESQPPTTKRNKVHMIINQLEANGQLTLIGGGGGSSRPNGSNRNSLATK